MTTKKCTLCLVNDANKTNSHIFPRFMGVSLLTTEDGKREGYTVGDRVDVMNARKNQDTPKEDYILCDKCESKYGRFETVIANNLIKKLKDPIHNSLFSHIKFNGFNKTFVPTISNKDLKLCVLSMLHRAHVSSLPMFSNCQLSTPQFDEIRGLLNDEILYKDYPILILTSGDDRYGENYYYAHSTADRSTHILWVNDYIFIIFLENNTPQVHKFKELVLCTEEETFVGIIPPDTWTSIRESLRKASIHFLMNK